ncbi:MAG: hypothetical protein COB51_06155 [Moraxellaceae bacterium]|nr:MAG: hypothetical protein COB51_06155 [Moraxellaceae bacterium]
MIIRYDVDSSPHQALFENKTYSTIHSDQLARYRDQFPGFKHYKYLKLARVNYNERRLAKKYGYDVLTSYDLFDAINLIGLESEILAQYKQFLLNHFIEPINQIESVLVSENKYDLFSDIQAQQYLIDLLYEKIDGLNDALYFKSSSNLGGSPWTQLDICKREHAYSNISEYLFWRIDKRSGSYYLRLNQYARVDSIDERRKFENLELLREVIKPLFKNHGLCVSDPSDRGVKESEVCIVFFKDNNLKTIREVLADLTLEIVEKYWNIDFQ